MKYKVKCTHIVSQLKNIKKYENRQITRKNWNSYIEVDDDLEQLCIQEMELYMSRALWWYKGLVEATSK